MTLFSWKLRQWRLILAAGCTWLLPNAGTAQATSHALVPPLRVFFIDVEGGQATLFVTPDGHSLLIDAGWPGNQGRDADRIVAAAQRAGLHGLDYVLITHFHDDHVGGVPQLVARLPVGAFLDHGPNREMDHGVTEHGYAEYQRVLQTGRSQHITLHPGQTLPLGEVQLRVISADGNVLAQALPGAGKPNAYCATTETRPPDQTENSRSLGVELTFGKLRLLDLGDLTWDKERELMCPTDRLGPVDVLVVSHHGWYQSSSPALVDAVHPRVAVMDNGEQKGGSVPTLKTMRTSPGLQDLWQLHYSAEGGASNNVSSRFIANLQGSDPGNYLELRGDPNGSFTVFNSRTGETVPYPLAVQTALQP